MQRWLQVHILQPLRGPGAVRDWVIWVATRAWLVPITFGRVQYPDPSADLGIYLGWVQASLHVGRFPADDLWQYPPLTGSLLLLGGWLPGERLGMVALFVLFDAAIMAMVGFEAHRLRRRAGRLLWALAPLVVGPLLIARYDVVPTALAVAAVLLSARPTLSGSLAAMGAWLKLWPALTVLGLRRADIPRGLLGAALTTAVISGVLVASTQDAMSFLAGQRHRGLQVESAAALPFLMAKVVGFPIEIGYRYGAYEILAPGAEEVALACSVVTALLLVGIVVLRLLRRLEDLAPADIALAAVLLTVASSRVFSGQYYIWLIGLAALCLSDPNTAVRPAVRLIVASAVLAHLVYPWNYGPLLSGAPAAVLLQAARIGLIVTAAAVTAKVLLAPVGRHAQPSGSRPARRVANRAALRSQPHSDSTH